MDEWLKERMREKRKNSRKGERKTEMEDVNQADRGGLRKRIQEN